MQCSLYEWILLSSFFFFFLLFYSLSGVLDRDGQLVLWISSNSIQRTDSIDLIRLIRLYRSSLHSLFSYIYITTEANNKRNKDSRRKKKKKKKDSVLRRRRPRRRIPRLLRLNPPRSKPRLEPQLPHKPRIVQRPLLVGMSEMDLLSLVPSTTSYVCVGVLTSNRLKKLGTSL